MIKSLMLTLSIDAILTSISKNGCAQLEHQRDIVASFLFNCSVSHLPLCFGSPNTIFSLFMCSITISESFSMVQFYDVICKATDYFWNYKNYIKNIKSILRKLGIYTRGFLDLFLISVELLYKENRLGRVLGRRLWRWMCGSGVIYECAA